MNVKDVFWAPTRPGQRRTSLQNFASAQNPKMLLEVEFHGVNVTDSIQMEKLLDVIHAGSGSAASSTCGPEPSPEPPPGLCPRPRSDRENSSFKGGSDH